MNLVAEFMIFANVKVAEKIAQSLPCALLRHHVAPPKENYNDLLRYEPLIVRRLALELRKAKAGP